MSRFPGERVYRGASARRPPPRKPKDAAARTPRLPGQAEFATFFEVSLDMLCIRDMDCKFVRVNRAWERALGYSVAELEGRPMLWFIHPDDVAPSNGHMQRLEVEEEVVGFVNRYRHRDGTYRHFEWRARRVGDQVFGVARDVTERLAIEAEMAAAREAAEAANRAKTDFLANMSHEIRTPLNGVVGIAAALSRTGLTAEQREMVGLIESSGTTLERLVSDVLDVAKIEAGRLDIESRLFDLRGELDGLLQVYQLRAIDKGLAFHLAYDDGAQGDFVGDSVRIKQVLGNLLSNAVKFTADGEVRVRIGAEAACDDSAAVELVMDVRDTGVGFDAAFSDSLFQRFTQADGTITRRFGGTGLGLSITRALVEMMGGDIHAESEPGRGSRFRVRLPLMRQNDETGAFEQPARGAFAAQAGGVARLASLRVLLADDHPVNQRVVQLILRPFGVEVTTVADGVQAVEAFAGGAFDVVLMDMQMPAMDGLAATRAIREREVRSGRARTPVVMLSANTMPQHRADARAAGADLHIAKPVTVDSLIGALLEALESVARPEPSALAS
jgi:two-component system, sensor histidine kinase